MAVSCSLLPDQAWRRRLLLPTYQVQEAARCAHIAPKTVAQWQRGTAGLPLAPREPRKALSYLQLIEVAVVAALRKEGVLLRRIREAREYIQAELVERNYPFAEYPGSRPMGIAFSSTTRRSSAKRLGKGGSFGLISAGKGSLRGRL